MPPSPEADHRYYINLSAKRSPSVVRFCRKVRLARGNKCENCGATPQTRQIESHHILDFHLYPHLAKDEANITVLCQLCHTGLSSNQPDLLGERLLAYTGLKRELRERIAAYAETHDPNLTTFAAILRSGHEAARNYFFNRLEMRRPRL